MMRTSLPAAPRTGARRALNRIGRAFVIAAMFGTMFGTSTGAAPPARAWIVSWVGSVQGPYPSGNAVAQPNLDRVFPVPASGARNQTFRLMVHPSVWGTRARIRLSNVFGSQPVTFDGVFAGLRATGGSVASGTNQAVTFVHRREIRIEPGAYVWSDAIDLPFVARGNLAGQWLAVSFHVLGVSGPMTWHAKAMTTSYVTAPDAGAHGADESDAAFPFSTTSWYFLDAVDMWMPTSTKAIVAFGDSITDGTASTLNGNDRWPDVLAARLDARWPGRFSVVNAGIGGNQVVGPATYTAAAPAASGPSASDRLDRDVLGLSGVSAIIWLEGINDFSTTAHASVGDVERAMTALAGRMRRGVPGVRIIGATLTSALGSTNAVHGSAAEDTERQELNAFIRTSSLFDGVADFDRATVDAATGQLRAEFVPDSSTGGPGDHLHPNRAGYLAMGQSIDLALFAARP